MRRHADQLSNTLSIAQMKCCNPWASVDRTPPSRAGRRIHTSTRSASRTRDTRQVAAATSDDRRASRPRGRVRRGQLSSRSASSPRSDAGGGGRALPIPARRIAYNTFRRGPWGGRLPELNSLFGSGCGLTRKRKRGWGFHNRGLQCGVIVGGKDASSHLDT